MAKDYIPNGDAQFIIWLKTFALYVNGNFAALGLTMTQNTDLQTLVTQMIADFNAAIAAQSAANTANQLKDTTRAAVEAMVRTLVKTVQPNLTVTDDQRAALGITIADTSKTPAPVPATRPTGTVDNRQRLLHIIHYYDDSTPNSKARPDGVKGCEFWLKVGGAAPTGPGEVTYAGTDARTPYSRTFDAADAGKTAHWMFRWLNTRNEPGPWSETLSFTITG